MLEGTGDPGEIGGVYWEKFTGEKGRANGFSFESIFLPGEVENTELASDKTVSRSDGEFELDSQLESEKVK